MSENAVLQNEPKPDRFDFLLRVGGFVVVAFLALTLSSALFAKLDGIARPALSVFLAAVAANLLLAKKFGVGRPADFGLGWLPGAFRHLVTGSAVGFAAVAVFVSGAVLAGLADVEPATANWSPLWVAVMLFVGALGEEMFFRGYAFQFLVREWSAPFTILGFGALFGFAHLWNNNVQWLGATNTALWGCLLGYAYARTRMLWLPVGLHFGWNLALVLFTSNISGTTIKATAWDLRWSASELWSGGAYGLEGGLLATVAAVVVFVFVRRVR